MLKHELMRTRMRKVGAFLSRNAIGTIKDKTNMKNTAAVHFRGKWHLHHRARSKHAVGDQNALRVAAESIEQQVNPHIVEEIRRFMKRQPRLSRAPLKRCARSQSSVPQLCAEKNSDQCGSLANGQH